MTQYKYLRLYIGDNSQSSHIDAVHAQNPQSDQYTGDIVLNVIKEINASGIIATISRTEMDINRPRDNQNAPAIDEYRNAIKNILTSKKIIGTEGQLIKPYLHLAIHGMRDDRKSDFEIGSRFGDSCSKNVLEWFMTEIGKISKQVNLDNHFPGDQSKAFHRVGDLTSNYSGYGDNFNTIQIEINRTLRKNNQQDLTDFLSKVMLDFDKNFRV